MRKLLAICAVLAIIAPSLSISAVDAAIKDTVNQKGAAQQDLNANKADPFVAKLFTNGLTKFESASSVQYLQKVPHGALDNFVNYLVRMLGVPADKQVDFKDTIHASAYMENNEWKEFDFIYRQNGTGGAKYSSILVFNIDGTAFDFLIADVKATFELGDDIFVSTSTKSKFFGLSSKTEVQIRKVPAVMTQKSIDLIFKFFKIVAYDSFAKFRGL